MTKSKRPIAKQRKRPKSVLKKAWQTRRAKALEEINAQAAEMVPGLNQLLYGDNATTMVGASGGNQASKPPSDYDAITRTLDLNREEQLLGFMGDMAAIRSTRQSNNHHPLMVSRTQAEAIEQFLSEHGYSAWGRASIDKAA